MKGQIRNMTAYGAFVELEDGIDGMIHVSDLSWTRKINHPMEVFKKNDEVEAEVIDIDKTNQRISLGIKQLSDDPWKNIDEKYKIGDLVTARSPSWPASAPSCSCRTTSTGSSISRS